MLAMVGRWFERGRPPGGDSYLDTMAEALEARQLLSGAPLNLLFFGNSFTYYTTNGPQYNMPATLKSIAVADGFAAPNVYEQILLGETLADQLNTIASAGSSNIISDSLPAGQQWSDVIEQEYSTRPTDATALEGDVPLFRTDALQLYNEVKANSPVVKGVLFETWARGSLDSVYPTYFTSPTDMQNQLQNNYNLAAGDINAADGAGSAVVSPVGEAWRGLNWEASLYSTISGDGVEYHPSTEGELLNAMVLFDTIYHADVATIPLANVSGILSNLDLSTSTWTTLAAAAVAVATSSDTTPPTASLGSAQAITAASTAAYDFTVNYSDNVAIAASSLGNKNLLVTGPDGYSELATLLSSGLSNGPSVTADYSVPAPSAGWTAARDGTYTIALNANQVSDTSENFALPVASLGTFTVNIAAPGAGTLSASQAAAAAKYSLTTLGTGDWAHWGTNDNASSFDHKAGGGSRISNVTKLGSGSYGAYYDPSRDVSWTDGTPLASDSGDDGYIWANDALGAGYSFTMPASTTTQTLYVYAGGYSSGATLTAHLSDGSAADYVATASGSGLYANLYTISFKAASAGQTLKISYVKTTTINGSGGSVDLIAAALAGAPVKDTTPPTASVNSAPAIMASTNAAYTFTVTYTDNVAVNAATLGSNNLLVTGNGYSEAATLISTGLTNAPSVVATYSVPAPAGGWSNGSDGVYTIALAPNQVADISGNFAAPVASLGTFTVDIPASGAGTLNGSQATAAARYNLTTLGTSDWAHWGTKNNASSFDHKASGGSQISSITKMGSGSYGAYYDPSRDVSWTDGTPLAIDSGDNAYIWANNAIGAGYSFTVPASTTTRTLYVYAGGYSSGATLTAHLSDGSAANFVAPASGSGLYTNLYTITFKAASAGQTLTISYVKTTAINGSGGSVDLIAAALA
jgi:hypothetical protein